MTFDGRGISGFAFLRDGSLVYSSRREGSIRGLWWLAPGHAHPERLTSTTIDAGVPAASQDGKHIAVVVHVYDVNIWRIAADGEAVAGVDRCRRQAVARRLHLGQRPRPPRGSRTVTPVAREGVLRSSLEGRGEAESVARRPTHSHCRRTHGPGDSGAGGNRCRHYNLRLVVCGHARLFSMRSSRPYSAARLGLDCDRIESPDTRFVVQGA